MGEEEEDLVFLCVRAYAIGAGITAAAAYHDSRAMTRSPSPLAWRLDLPGATRVQGRRPGFNPWTRKIPGEGNGNPLQYSGLENSMD